MGVARPPGRARRRSVFSSSSCGPSRAACSAARLPTRSVRFLGSDTPTGPRRSGSASWWAAARAATTRPPSRSPGPASSCGPGRPIGPDVLPDWGQGRLRPRLAGCGPRTESREGAPGSEDLTWRADQRSWVTSSAGVASAGAASAGVAGAAPPCASGRLGGSLPRTRRPEHKAGLTFLEVSRSRIQIRSIV